MTVNVFYRSEKMPHPSRCVMLRPWNVDREAMCLCILHVHVYYAQTFAEIIACSIPIKLARLPQSVPQDSYA